MIHLVSKTNPAWVRVVTDNFDLFLQDHADCERKASAMAMNFVAKCPDQNALVKPLIHLALEELEHFKLVHQQLEKKGLCLNARMSDDPYVNRMLQCCRSRPQERLLDRLVAVGVVEARGAERFGLLEAALSDPELKAFYRNLYLSETKHGNVFIHIANQIFPTPEVETRLSFFLREEAAILEGLAWRPSLH